MKLRSGLLAIILGVSLLQSAYGSGPFDNPPNSFAEAFLPVLSRFEKARIEKTWRGFCLRADTQPGFRDGIDPSDAGIYLNVAARDPEEIPKFRDVSEVAGAVTRRTVEIPAPKDGGVALRIVFAYGSGASPEAVSAIGRSIAEIIKTNGLKTPAGGSDTAPAREER